MTIKRFLKKIYKKIKFIISCKIPNIFVLFFLSKGLKQEIMNNGVKNVKEYKFKYWHFNYRYYVGEYNQRKVFIKYNSNNKIIMNEVKNLKYLEEKSNVLATKIPKLYLYGNYRKGAFLVEEFYSYRKISDYIEEKININYQKIFDEFIVIIKEFQKIGFLHLDVTPSNIYISDKEEVVFIDLGFSMINNNNDLSFIGSKKKIRYVIEYLNRFSRLEKGCIDDAISFLMIANLLEDEFISKYYDKWREMNMLSNKLLFDNGEIIKNEN